MPEKKIHSLFAIKTGLLLALFVLPGFVAGQTTGQCNLSVTLTPKTLCNPEDARELTVSVVNGAPPYRVLINSTSTTENIGFSFNTNTFTIPNVPANAFSLRIVDALNCQRIFTNVQVPNSSNPDISLFVTGAVCVGKPFKISASLLPQSPGSVYLWNNGKTTPAIEETLQGPATFQVEVTFPNGCTSVKSLTISPSPNPRLDLPSSFLSCPGQTVSLEPSLSGGTRPFSFLWGPLGNSQTLLVNPTQTTMYSVKVIDANGCSDSIATTVLPTRSLKVSLEDSASFCPNTPFTLNPVVSDHTGPLKYQWNTGEKTPSLMLLSSVSQSYRVLVSDSLGCSGADSIYVRVFTVPKAVPPDTFRTCAGAEIVVPPPNLPATGQPYTFLWTNGARTPSVRVAPRASGIIECQITDKNGCSFQRKVYLKVAQNPEVVLPDSLAVCQGTQATIRPNVGSGTPAYAFFWTTGDTQPQLSKVFSRPERIGLIVKDALGCADTAGTFISMLLPPQVSLPDKIGACATDSVILATISGSQNLQYLWENGLNTPIRVFPRAQEGKFTLRATNLDGCSTVVSTSVEVYSLPILQIPPFIQACQGSSVNIRAQAQTSNGPVDFLWSDGRTGPALDIRVQDSLRISCTATDNRGCKATESLVVLPLPNPIVSLPASLSICAGQKTVLRPALAQGDSSLIRWNTGTISPSLEVQPLSGTLYTAIATNRFNCRDTASVNVQVWSLPRISISGTRSFCEGSFTLLTANVLSGNTPFQYSWSAGSNTSFLSVDSSNYNKGTIHLRTTDVHGCISQDTAIVSLLKSPEVRFPSGIKVCENQLASLTPLVSGGQKPYSYLWSTGAGTASVTIGAGTYQLEVTDAKGCTGNGFVQIASQVPPEVGIRALVQPSCGNPDGAVTLSVQSSAPPVSVRWSNGATGAEQKNLFPGSYTVIARDSLNCQREIKVELTCICAARVGKMDTAPLSFCRFDTATAKYDATGEVQPPGSRRWFVLHNNPGNQIGNIIFYADTIPHIRFQTGMLAGATYYLSAVIAAPSPQGGPNFGDQCLSVSAGTPVTLLPAPEKPNLLNVADSLVCPGSTFQINTNRQLDGATYIWNTPRGNFTTASPAYTLSNFSAADVGGYFVSVAFGQCASARLGPLNIRISKEIAEIFTEPDKVLCGSDSTVILANAPGSATGKWTSSSPAGIVSPNEESTLVRALAPGRNLFFWNVITRNCVVQDTLVVYYFAKPSAQNDTLSLNDDRNTALFDILKNDVLKDIPAEYLKIELVKKPPLGNIRTDAQGNLIFQRDNNIAKDQEYVLTYQVCNNDPTVNCSERCSEAQILIQVAYNPKVLIYPAIGLRPGYTNPVWQFEAARPMFSARLSILDRWGQVVHKEDYPEIQKGELVKSWNGLRGSTALPAGAYYFALEGTIENDERVVQTGILYLMN
jgi:hypothetical protein